MAGYRPAYTIDEQNIILQIIIQTGAYYKLRSRSMWVDMENSGYLDRTWQSLKEHFEKKILPNIDNPRFEISYVEKRLIVLGYSQTARA